MKENPYHSEQDEIRELLKQYSALKNGRKHSFLDEDCFEKIIDYYDGKEEFPHALEAVEIGIEQYPFSSILLIRKADLLIATRKYADALQVLGLVAGGAIELRGREAVPGRGAEVGPFDDRAADVGVRQRAVCEVGIGEVGIGQRGVG